MLLYDTQHRTALDHARRGKYEFENYDGALVLNVVLEKIYRKKKWIANVWIEHEAADPDF